MTLSFILAPASIIFLGVSIAVNDLPTILLASFGVGAMVTLSAFHIAAYVLRIRKLALRRQPVHETRPASPLPRTVTHETKFCIVCGVEIQDAANFCGSCGGRQS